MKTEILRIKGDWQEVVDDARATVKKPPLGHEPSSEFKRRILMAEHDPIRDIIIKFRWRDIPYWIAMHFKTHIWRSRTNSQRNDRQAHYDRTKAPQDSPVDFIGDVNAQHGIDTSRKRLCYQAAKDTREYWENLKIAVREVEPEISDSWVPNCVYRCGCCETPSCGYWKRLTEQHPEILTDNLQERYDIYNNIFEVEYGQRKNH